MVQSQETRVRSEKDVLEDMERLRDWLDKQPHLPHVIDDDMLRAFVWGTKSLEIAKRKVDSWYSYRTKIPHLLSITARDQSDTLYKERSKAIKIFFLPKATADGSRVMWYQAGPEIPNFYHPQKIARAMMLIEIAVRVYPDMKNIICVYDMFGLPNPGLLTKVSATSAGAGLQWYQDAVPVRLKKVIVINSFPIIEALLNSIIKPFMKEKLFNRISLTTDGVEALKQFLPVEMLPSDYGGNEKSSDELNAEWEKIMEDQAVWFEKTAQLMSDEKKRPVDKQLTYGMEGTFRTLALD